MTFDEKVEILVRHIRNHTSLVMVTEIDGPYGHMGATLADAVLQAGLRYETVVMPRVEYIRRTFPAATTTSSFAAVIEQCGASEVLQIKGRKPATMRLLIDLLRRQGIETEDQLKSWLDRPANRFKLHDINGIKEKTADYLHNLVGGKNVAVDRHLFSFLAEAGLGTDNYADAQELIRGAAGVLGVSPEILDHSIWRHFSGATFVP